jgi:hypothetical protein
MDYKYSSRGKTTALQVWCSEFKPQTTKEKNDSKTCPEQRVNVIVILWDHKKSIISLCLHML